MERDEGCRLVIRFLMQPHMKRQEIVRTERRIESLRECVLPGAVRYDKDRVQTTPENQMEKAIVEITSLEEQLIQLKCELASLIIKTNKAIDLLQDPAERSVLTFYYVNRYSPRKTANMIGYSERSMYRIKRRAVKNLVSEWQNISVL